MTNPVHLKVNNVCKFSIPQCPLQHAVNWVSSSEPLGTPLASWRGHSDVQRVSAGTPKHEVTSWSAFEKIFEWFLTEPEDDNNVRSNVDESQGKKKSKQGGQKGKKSNKKDEQKGEGVQRKEGGTNGDKKGKVETGGKSNEEDTVVETKDDVEVGEEVTEEDSMES